MAEEKRREEERQKEKEEEGSDSLEKLRVKIKSLQVRYCCGHNETPKSLFLSKEILKTTTQNYEY